MTSAAEHEQIDSTQLSGCGICLESAKDPRLLECLHSFCKGCLDDLDMRSGHKHELKCPLCRALTLLPGDGSGGLPKDISRRAEQAGAYACNTCKLEEVGGKAEIQCLTCDLQFCKNHVVPHMLSNPSHAASALSERNVSSSSSPSTSTSGITAGVCPEHNLPLKYFCKSCSVRVCPDCVLVGTHRGHHPVVPVAHITADLRERVRNKTDKLQNVLPNVVKSLSAVETTCTNLTAAADRVRAEIRSARKRAVDAIDAIVHHKLVEVEDIEQTRLKVLSAQQEELQSYRDNVKSAISFSDKLLAQDLDVRGDVCGTLRAVEKRVEKLEGVRLVDKPVKHCRIAFKSVSEDTLFCQAKKMVGDVLHCKASPVHTHVDGNHEGACWIDAPVYFVLVGKGDDDKPLTEGGDDISTKWVVTPESAQPNTPQVQVIDKNDGSYNISFTPKHVGHYVLQLSVNGDEVQQRLSIICSDWFTFDKARCQTGNKISEDKLTVTHTRGLNYSSVLGDRGMECGCHVWAVKINQSETMDIYLGVTSTNTLKKSNYKLTYSWHGSGEKWIIGKNSEGMSKWKVNDILQLELNCDQHVLSITNTCSGQQDKIADLPAVRLFPVFDLFHPNDSITLVPTQ